MWPNERIARYTARVAITVFTLAIFSAPSPFGAPVTGRITFQGAILAPTCGASASLQSGKGMETRVKVALGACQANEKLPLPRIRVIEPTEMRGLAVEKLSNELLSKTSGRINILVDNP